MRFLIAFVLSSLCCLIAAGEVNCGDLRAEVFTAESDSPIVIDDFRGIGDGPMCNLTWNVRREPGDVRVYSIPIGMPRAIEFLGITPGEPEGREYRKIAVTSAGGERTIWYIDHYDYLWGTCYEGGLKLSTSVGIDKEKVKKVLLSTDEPDRCPCCGRSFSKD